MKELKKINDIILEKSYFDNRNSILSWLEDEKLGNYFLDKIEKEKFEDLKEIDFLLEELIKARNPFFALNLLENSISEKNNAYIFNFIDKHLEYLLKRDNDTFGNHTADIVDKIVSKFPKIAKKAFDYVKKYIKVHPEEFKDLRASREHGKQVIAEIIFKIFNIWKEKKRTEDIEKLVKIIGDKFNLIDDDYHFSMFTPDKIFSVLYGYVIVDFEKNFSKIVEILANQFKDKKIGYGKEYDGKEWSGSGISQSGEFYSITDRHLVGKVLAPAAKYFYENATDKEAAWQKIKGICFVSEKEISPKKPDFLNRALIPIAIERYAKLTDERKKEAFEILKNFIDMTSVPDKGHIIFQEVLRLDMSDADKWNLVEASLNAKWNKNKLPADVFVEQIVSSLAEKGERKKEAKRLINEWLKNEEYIKRQNFGESNILGIISKLLSGENKREGIEIFEKYVYSDAFRGLERFDSFEVAEKVAGIIDYDSKKGIEILQKIYSYDKLNENGQILICSGINKISKPEVRIRVYNEFLKPALDSLENDIEKIMLKFSYDYPRTAIVEFGDELAKEKKFTEALEIAKIFINDPDPRIDDKENNLHERIAKGEEESAITSVRGWVCWLLHQFPVLEGRKYIPEIMPLIRKLSKDQNYYIRSQVCFPLAELMRVRNSVMPEAKDEFFLGRDDAKNVEDIAVEMLKNERNQKLKAVMINLAHVFSYMRSMSTEQALEILNIFKDNKFSESSREISSLYIFYAEFRKDAFKEGVLKNLEEFNDEPFKKLLKDLLRNGPVSARLNLLWQLMGLINESEKNPKFIHEDAFRIASCYIKIIAEKYEVQIFTHIFRFIKENIEKKYDECSEFFISCLKKEKEALDSEKIDKTWIPFYYHRDILEEIFKKGDKKIFLNAIDIMSNYHSQYSRWEEIKDVFRHLIEYPKDNKRVGEILDKLIENNPAYYDMKVEWENK